VDRFFDYMEIPEEHRVKLVSYKLKVVSFPIGNVYMTQDVVKERVKFVLGIE